jgi:hypothetical protein
LKAQVVLHHPAPLAIYLTTQTLNTSLSVFVRGVLSAMLKPKVKP